MTKDELKSITEIEGTGGFLAIQRLTEQKIRELDSVSNIDESSNVAARALGKKYAVILLKDFLSDLKILSKTNQPKDNTHE